MKKSGNHEKHIQKRNTGKIWLVIAGVILAAYIVGIIFFQSHYLPKTVINGISCSMETVTRVQQSIEEEVDSYMLRIDGRNGLTDTISGAEIALKPVFDDSLSQILQEQNGFLWPVSFWKGRNYDVSTVAAYDETAFWEKLQGMVFFRSENQIPPRDAYLSDVTAEGYQVVPDEKGSTLQEDTYKSVISEAVLTLADSLDLDAAGCYVQAAVLENDSALQAACGALNALVKTTVVYEFGEDTVTVTPEVIAGWLDPDSKTPVLVKDKVREFVNDMARQYDTFGKRRTFTTHTGEEIEITQGSYGWWMNRSQETTELMEMVERGESGTRTPVYFGTAAQYGKNDWGDSYVEIDMTEQRLYLYMEGVDVLESDFVSGNVSRGFETPTGIYGITYKERNATLQGQGYNSHVSYWMPFNDNVGMHDASWRKAFGEEIYLTNGSHGCINLPTEAAEKIYELVEQNTPVIVHGGKTLPKKEETEIPAEGVEGETPETVPPTDGIVPETTPPAAGAIPETVPPTDSTVPEMTPPTAGALPENVPVTGESVVPQVQVEGVTDGVVQ